MEFDELVKKIEKQQRTFRFDKAYTQEEGTILLHFLSLALGADLQVRWDKDRQGFVVTLINKGVN